MSRDVPGGNDECRQDVHPTMQSRVTSHRMYSGGGTVARIGRRGAAVSPWGLAARLLLGLGFIGTTRITQGPSPRQGFRAGGDQPGP
jgi:hypothetical protein